MLKRPRPTRRADGRRLLIVYTGPDARVYSTALELGCHDHGKTDDVDAGAENEIDHINRRMARKTLEQPHHVILAKLIRLERVELFARLAQAEKALRGMLDTYTKTITADVMRRGKSLANIRKINRTLHLATVTLRASMRVWMNALIRDAVKMGFRHPGDAIKPVFKDNQEAVTNIIAEQALFEAKLTFNMNLPSGSTPGVKTSSTKWTSIGQKIIKNVAKDNLQGLTVSERIWELTGRSEQDLKRIIANGIANGNSPYEISQSIEGYVSPSVSAADELGIETGPGIYRSAYKNAMRLARTETNRAYTQASVNFYKNKPWVSEVNITLSPDHDEEDECDDLADEGPYSPEEADGLIPAHPHCMCMVTPVIDPQYLGEDEAA